MHLCEIPPDQIPKIEIPTGLPLVFDWNYRCFRLLEDGISENPLDRYNFGSAPELLFKVQKNLLTGKYENHENILLRMRK
jgi:hypothetical protein